jgi:thymidylate synthase
MVIATSATTAWLSLLKKILTKGRAVSPRGQGTLECLSSNTLVTRLDQPLVEVSERKLNYQFAAAEALWILSGSNELAPLQRFIKGYGRFSDDGLTLSGAYGPPVMDQLPYVVDCLVSDRETRQAVLTIWKPDPKPSKDIPCTVTMVFSIRDGFLHQHVLMRSSDAWLGVPYDLFSFSMIGTRVACWYNSGTWNTTRAPVSLGRLTTTLVSSHLYDRDREAVTKVLATASEPASVTTTPDFWVRRGNWDAIERELTDLRESAPYSASEWQLSNRYAKRALVPDAR